MCSINAFTSSGGSCSFIPPVVPLTFCALFTQPAALCFRSCTSPPQAAWVKQAGSVAELINRQGQAALDMMREMEKVAPGGRLTPGQLRPALEGLADPEDFRMVVSKMTTAAEKPTIDRLKKVSQEVKWRRYWQWVLDHPSLGPDKIHPTRSMPFF